MNTVLEVNNLSVSYTIRGGVVEAVRDVSFKVYEGEAFGLLGESGCGKTTLANALLDILPDNAEIVGGEILYLGENLVDPNYKKMNSIRWGGISMIFQAALNAFSPVHKVGEQIVEAVTLHQNLKYKEARERVYELYNWVGIDSQLFDRYPHEYSGGMRQRAMIAMALSCDPKLVIADEPTTALDVLVQKQILAKLRDIQKELQTGFIYVSHDISVISEMSKHIGVMYAGKLVETGLKDEIFKSQKHPYTKALFDGILSVHGEKRENIVSIDGEPPDLTALPTGCAFQPRCTYATDECLKNKPEVTGNEEHSWRCFNPPTSANTKTATKTLGGGL